MLPISAHALASLPRVTTVHVAAEYSNDGTTWTPVTVTGGDVTADRTAETRYTASTSLVDVPIGRTGINTVSTLIRLRRGISSVRRAVEWIPAGTYAVARVSRDQLGQVQVTLEGLESLLREARFPKRRIIGPGPADHLVGLLVDEALPGVTVTWREGVDERTTIPRMVVDDSRWDVLSAGENADGKSIGIARALAAECYIDAGGAFVVDLVPSILDEPVWDIGRGAGGVLLEYSDEQTAEGVYNLVVATGDNGDGSPMVGPAYAWDNDPASLTYAGPDPVNDPLWPHRNGRRDIRVRLKQYSSPILKSNIAAEQAARSILNDSLGVQTSLSFQSVCNPALEPGDVVRVEVDPGLWQLHIIDQVRWSLTGVQMECQTRTTQRSTE